MAKAGEEAGAQTGLAASGQFLKVRPLMKLNVNQLTTRGRRGTVAAGAAGSAPEPLTDRTLKGKEPL
jgi:hypothetical protein